MPPPPLLPLAERRWKGKQQNNMKRERKNKISTATVAGADDDGSMDRRRGGRVRSADPERRNSFNLVGATGPDLTRPYSHAYTIHYRGVNPADRCPSTVVHLGVVVQLPPGNNIDPLSVYAICHPTLSKFHHPKDAEPPCRDAPHRCLHPIIKGVVLLPPASA